MDKQLIKKQLQEKGYCIIPGVLNQDEIEYSIDKFKKWQSLIPNHDKVHNTIDPHGIYKHHRAGHTPHAWFIRTRKQVQDIFKGIWETDELVVSFDGSCYISKNNKSKDKIWTHTDQSSKSSDFKCIQGYVALTDNKERTFRVYEGSNLLHKGYFEKIRQPLLEQLNDIKTKIKDTDPEEKDKIEKLKEEKNNIDKHIKKYDTNWQLIEHYVLKELDDKKRVLNVKAGSLVLWDSRSFHQNQYGAPNSEERMVQYVCYLPKNNPLNTKSMQKKRLKYYKEQRTTSHWPYPLHVNGLQPRTYGDNSKLIDYDLIPMNDLKEFEDEILKII